MAKKEKIGPATAFDQAIMSWTTYEFLRYPRGWIWFTVFGLIFAALITYAITTHSITMAVVFSVVPLVIILEHKRKPKVVQVVVSSYGIKFGEIKLAFSDIKKFWILHEMPYLNELHLLTNRKHHPEFTIPLLDLDPSPIRAYLVTQVPEQEGKEESFLDTLIRLLKLA
ncbi:MAG: hypothetical protein AAB802_04975 [Patescibacteria group bacterium]